MNYGWTAPTIPKLKQPDSPVTITQEHIVWLEVLITLGGLAGLLITIYLVDTIGRKRTILIASITGFVGWTVIASARSVILLFVARFVVGMAGDVAFVATPMYIAEIADERVRGTLGGLIYVLLLMGLVTVYSVAPFVKIYVCALVGVAVTTLQFVCFSFMPESPYYLLVKGDVEGATESLKFLRRTQDVGDELEAIREAVERQQAERGRPQDLILVQSNRKAMIIMTVLNAAQHFCGVLVLLMNLHTILKQANSVYLNENLTAILFALLMLIFALISISLIDKFGRKVLLTTSSIFTALSLYFLAGYFAFQKAGFDTKPYSWIPIFSVMFYAAVYRFGIGMVPIIMTGELFPTNVKAMGVTYSDGVYVVVASIVLFAHEALAKIFGLHVPFFFYATCCLLTAAFCMLYVPETKGRTLEEIQMLLKGDHNKK